MAYQDPYQPPLIPGYSNAAIGGQGTGNYAQGRNPQYTIANQYLPRNLKDVIRWSKYITAQSPVTSEVLRKLATFPITSFTYSSDDESVQDKYQEISKNIGLKYKLHKIGFDYHTLGNVFVSLYLPFVRMLYCNQCNEGFNSANAEFIRFKAFEFEGVCLKCSNKTKFRHVDTKSMNTEDMEMIVWDPLHIGINHNPISGKSKYYYTVPGDIKKQIRDGNMLFISTLEWGLIEAVKQNKDFEFAPGTIYHLKNLDTSGSANGFSVPPLVSHFNLVFYQATLRRANESIATDFMTPLRVLYPTAQTGNGDPVVTMSLRNFASKMEQAMVEHKRDNNSVLIAPVPIGYQAISGEGKTLLVAAEIEQAEDSLLLSMGVSRELLTGTTNWTSSTVGLRMLKNTLDSYVGQILELLVWASRKIGVYLQVPECHIGLVPFQLTDDDNLKQLLLTLAPEGKVSMTTLFESLGRSYDEEQSRMLEEAKSNARNAVRTKFEIERATYLEGVAIAKESEKTDDYLQALQKANVAVQELLTMAPDEQQAHMAQIKRVDYGQYALISHLMEEQMVATGQTDQEGNPIPQEEEDPNAAPASSDKKPEKKEKGPMVASGGSSSKQPAKPAKSDAGSKSEPKK
jgi:hypothetical protein